MSNQQEPDLSFRTNQLWAFKIAVGWTLLMVPSSIARIQDEAGMGLLLSLLGMVGFWTILFRSFSALTGGLTLKEMWMKDVTLSWPLLLGIGAWYFFLSTLSWPVLIGIFQPVIPV